MNKDTIKSVVQILTVVPRKLIFTGSIVVGVACIIFSKAIVVTFCLSVIAFIAGRLNRKYRREV